MVATVYFRVPAAKVLVAKAPMSRQRFAEDYMAAAKLHVPGGRFEYQASDFSIKATNPDGSQWTAFLDNAYAVVLAHPQDEAQILERYIGSMTSKKLPEALSHADRLAVLPVIKPEVWVTEAQQQLAAAKKPSALLSQPLADGLDVVYVLNSAETMRFISTSALGELGLRLGDVPAQAGRNLAMLLPELRVEQDGGVYRLRLDGNYEASMLLMYPRWRERFALPRDPVVAIPARGEVLLADGGNRQAVEHMQAAAKMDSAHSPYAVTPKLYVIRDGRWSTWQAQ